ncbi:MAG: hypothetical protein V4543_16235, partial [Bacteroidota bacterium]
SAFVITTSRTPTLSSGGTICGGSSMTLNATGADTYVWSPATGLSSAGGATVTASPTVNTTYTVTGTKNGCTQSKTVTVNVTAQPATPAVSASGSTTICTGDSVILSGPTGFSYIWSDGATTRTRAAYAAGTYTLKTITTGCTSAASAGVTVSIQATPAVPVVSANGPLSFCTGDSVTLSATGSNLIWSNGAITSSIRVKASGTFTVRSAGASCTSAASAPVTVSVNNASSTPTVSLSGPVNFCSGNTVTLTAPAGYAYSWSNGQTTQAITVSTAGTYTVRTIAGTCTSGSSAGVTVTVNASPAQPTISAGGPVTFCQGGSVTLTAPAGLSYLWNSGETSQSVTKTSAGIYSVQTIANGCTSAASAATTVTVNAVPAKPTVSLNGPASFCTGGSLTLTAPGGYAYIWSNGATSQSITVSGSGSYSVSTVSTGCTSVSSDVVFITVSPAPTTPVITAGGPLSFCIGGSVVLSAPAGFSYLWSSGQTSQSITASSAGSYTVRTISGSCTSAVSASSDVSINTTPAAPTVTANGPLSFCEGSSVTLSGPAGFGYIWSSGETTQSINATASGSYSLRTYAGSCTSATSNVTSVVVNPAPATPAITALGPITFCTGGSVTLSAPAGFSYLWSNGATTQTISVGATRTYTVRTIFGGCTSATSNAIPVTVNSVPATPAISAGGPLTFCQGGTVTLSGPAGFSYLWSTGETTQNISVATSGAYTLRTYTGSTCTSATSNATTVTVDAVPTAPVITAGGPLSFCTGGSVVLTAAAGTGYIWNGGQTTQSITVTTGGTYSVRSVTGACTSAASNVTVTVSTAPATPGITAGGPLTFCEGSFVNLSGPAGLSYIWSTGESTQTIRVTASGSYTLRTVNGNCTSAVSAATAVTVNPALSVPTVTTSGPSSFCEGGSVTLTAPTGFSYIWSNGQTSRSITAVTAGAYNVRVYNASCTSSASSDVAVTVTPAPTTPSRSASTSTGRPAAAT